MEIYHLPPDGGTRQDTIVSSSHSDPMAATGDGQQPQQQQQQQQVPTLTGKQGTQEYVVNLVDSADAGAGGIDPDARQSLDQIPKEGSYFINRHYSTTTTTTRSPSAMGGHADHYRDIDFSPGASDMPTAAPPVEGSYSLVKGQPYHHRDNNNNNQYNIHNRPLEINVTPERLGKDMPTAFPPRQGSYIGQSVPVPLLPSSSHQSSSTTPTTPNDKTPTPTTLHQDIHFIPQSLLPPDQNIHPVEENIVEESQPTNVNVVVMQNINNNHNAQLVHNDDINQTEDIDNYVPSKSLRAMEKQLDHVLNQSIESDNDDDGAGGLEFHPSTSSESDKLTSSIQKLGALFGSVHQETTTISTTTVDGVFLEESVESEDDASAGLSQSIQRLGVLLGSNNNDDNTDSGSHHQSSGPPTRAEPSELARNTTEEDKGEETDHQASFKVMEVSSFHNDEEERLGTRTVVLPNDSDDKKVLHAKETASKGEDNDEEEVEEPFVPDDSIARLEAALDEALDAPLELEHEPGNGVESKDSHVHDESLSALDNFLDMALNDDEHDEPIDEISKENEESTPAGELEDIVPTMPESSIVPAAEHHSDKESFSALDDFLDMALDDDIPDAVIEQQKLPEKTERLVSETRNLSETTSQNAVLAKDKRPKTVAPPRASRTSTVASKVNSAPKPQQPQTQRARKPAIPIFRSTTRKRSEPEKVQKKKSPPTVEPQKKGMTALLGRKKPTEKRASFMSETFSSRIRKSTKEKDAATAERKSVVSTTTGERRSKGIVSTIASWTKRRTDRQKNEEIHVRKTAPPNHTPGSKPAPVRLFKPETKSINDNLDPTSTPKIEHNQAISDDTSIKPDLSSPEPTRLSNPKRFQPFSPMDYSVTSISSQCSVSSFMSPRRAGKRGCQKKFNPYLHTTRGPCELCVFHLSDDDKEKLFAEGRHVRVMFTTGGCCKTCEVFPRGFDEVPARLCRICYDNSHRKVYQRRRLGRPLVLMG